MAGAVVDVAVLAPVLVLLSLAADHAYQHSGAPNEALLLYPLAGTVLVLACQFVFLAALGATAGMLLTGLQLVSADGRQAAASQVAIRVLVSCLSLSAFGLGYTWAFCRPAGQTWHDIASCTAVIRRPRNAGMGVSRKRRHSPDARRHHPG